MTLRHYIVPAYLILCILLGGASRAGWVGNLVLQLAGLPIIVWTLLHEQKGPPVPARTLVALVFALVTLMLIQLIPMPGSIWAALPGRQQVAEGFALLGEPLPWLPFSMKPAQAVYSLLWLLPAIATLLGIVRLGAYRSTLVAWCLVGVTVLSVMVAAMQLTGGRGSAFYFYRVTNFGSGVGFFANSNHQATLLLCALPFVAALYADFSRSRSIRRASGLAVVLAGVAMILAVGIIINGSLAGLGLGFAVAFLSLTLLRYRSQAIPPWPPLAAAAALIGAVALIFFGPLSGGALVTDAETSTISRQTMVGITLQAARDYMPLGSGIGTFTSVYRTYEDPASVDATWVNHAHSDIVEIVLETGIFGIFLMLAFLIWWGRRAYGLWLKDDRPDHFARAAVIASAAIMAHSIVDYPLRTSAISVLFAACVAIMAQPRPSTRHRLGAKSEVKARHINA